MPRINEPEAIASSYVFAVNVSRSAALPVHSKQLRPGQINHLQAEPAIARDPLADRNWVEPPQRSRSRIVDDLKAEKAGAIRSVEAKFGVVSHANAVVRNNAEHHGAGGRA